MADTTFSAGTVVASTWLNNVNDYIYDSGVDVRAYGAIGDGSNDDTTAFVDAFAANNVVFARSGNWKITSTIALPANCYLDLSGSDIVASTGANPIFSFLSAKEGLIIKHGGGTISGTADSFLKCQGTTTTPSTSSDYARQIRLDSVYVSSTTITKFLDFIDAVRQVYIDKCYAYTVNGINANGKCVEISISNSIIYSSTGAASTYGIKLSSPAGTSYFNEGWHIVDCTIDNFDTSFDVNDIFALTVNGGYISGITYSFDFGNPTTTANHHINLSNFTCGKKIRFAPTGGYAYHAVLSSLILTGISGSNIQFADNASNITVNNCKFDTSSSGVAVEMVSNNANCVVDGIDCDSTFVGGVQVKGASGDDCFVGNITYDGSGDSLYLERPVRSQGVTLNTANTIAYNRKYNSSDLAASVTVSSTIASISIDCAKGETGYIDIAIPCSGMNAATQRFDITVPSGMVIPSGTGWDSKYILPSTTATYVTSKVPYYTTAAIAAGTLSISNAVGNTVTVGSHGRFGIVKDW